MLLLFAVVPTVVVTLLWTGAASRALSLMSAGSAWERVARSGERALESVQSSQLTVEQRRALSAHEAELRQSVELAKRFDFVASRTIPLIAVGALVVVGLVGVGASRVAGHLSRQLSRPLDELVGWTRLIRTTYRLLGLISFFTVGEEECRAWTIAQGTNAQRAAGAIHTDLQEHFIRAEVCHYEDFVKHGSQQALKEKGLLRLEGKDYIVKDGDIMEIRHSG
jgi:ribosome-binding ATPase YchF (GTP1/OBG family)